MERYYNDEPFSYGGKYRLFEYFDKDKVNDRISKSDIYIHILDNIENQKSIHQFMYIVNMNYFNLM